jgi:hypothetical protein
VKKSQTEESRHCNLCRYRNAIAWVLTRVVHSSKYIAAWYHHSVSCKIILKREAAGSAEILIPIYHISWCHIPEDSHTREILKISHYSVISIRHITWNRKIVASLFITIAIAQFILEIRFISILAEYENSSVQLLLNIHRVNVFVKWISFFSARIIIISYTITRRTQTARVTYLHQYPPPLCVVLISELDTFVSVTSSISCPLPWITRFCEHYLQHYRQ